jgi:hypothetical protein
MTAAPISISGPASLVEAVPYLLGFTPADSLVLVGLRERHVTVTARLDLDGLSGQQISNVLDVLATKGGSTAAVALTYGPVADTSAVAAAAESVGITITEHLRVHDGRYWSMTCPIEGCCPAEGTPIPVPSIVAAEFVAMGHAPAASRDQLAAQLDPSGDGDRLLQLLADAQQRLDADLAAGFGSVRASAETRTVLLAAGDDSAAADLSWSDEQLARIAAALTHYSVRDAVWMAVDAGRLDGRDLFAHLARQLPATHRAPALFLFAWKTWRTGNGALASIALDRVLEVDPDYTAAQLLRTALARGIDPRQMPALRLPA